MMKNRWYMYNVVWYDGVDAHVKKMIFHEDSELCDKEVREYFKPYTDIQVLKVDGLYPLDTENILAYYNMKDGGIHSSQQKEYNAAHEWAQFF